jgi:hypothetical protein
MITIDADVISNVKKVRRQVEQNRIVGVITLNRPDFEFANFAIGELVEIAARLDEAKGYSGYPVREAIWTGIKSGKSFEKKYLTVSARKPPSLKGQEWGEALATYAIEKQKRSDDGKERPLWREIHTAIQAQIANYDYQKSHIGFNRDTFDLIDLQNGSPIID